MKKTVQTLLTAAVFSAAVTSSMNVTAQEAALEKTSQPMAPLYGPPPVERWLGDMNEDDIIDARDLSVLKRYILLEGGKIELGETVDINGDGRIEVWSWGSSSLRTRQHLGDLNQDAVVDKADVKEMIRRLTGAPEDEEDPEETDDVSDRTEVTTITTTALPWEFTVPDDIVPLYGPPPVKDEIQ